MGYRYLDDFRRSISLLAIFLTVFGYWVPRMSPSFIPRGHRECVIQYIFTLGNSLSE